jgi:hypothetical protein
MNTCLFGKMLIEPTEIVSEHIIERDPVAQRSMITCLSLSVSTSRSFDGSL